MKKIILAVSVMAILLSVGSVIAKGPGSGANNKALKLIDASDRDLGYLVSLVSEGTTYYSGKRDASFYTSYNPDLDVFLTWRPSDGSLVNGVSVNNIYYSQPNCTGEAYHIVQFEGPEKPDCNTPITLFGANLWYRMDTCKLVSTTINSSISGGEPDGVCSSFPTTTFNDAYLVDSFDNSFLDPVALPLKVVEK
ncbi:MAG: hypothetical protein G01um101413_505 [Parcubacteria group bacterium Gr01-1014_13]|nr:MAG: hypothetical protein G01um101413_505 [Parcubacteria group bacterium Gr01-1014_13]